MNRRYRIAYCYPTSPNAEALGVPRTGGHYVEEQILREDGTWSPPHIAPGTEGDVFATADDPELLALLEECQRRS